MHRRPWPWLILIPRRPGLCEWFDLDPEEARRLLDEALALARVLRARAGADKINLAALGNQVAQLHVHVIARRRDDPAWPGATFGHPAPDLDPAQADRRLRLLHAVVAEAFGHTDLEPA